MKIDLTWNVNQGNTNVKEFHSILSSEDIVNEKKNILVFELRYGFGDGLQDNVYIIFEIHPIL